MSAFGDDLFDSVTPENRSLLWKQDLRIVPLSAFIYLLCYLDRSNIGNARIMNLDDGNDLESELNITDDKYIISLMLFLIAYALFEVPSNYFLKAVSPSVCTPRQRAERKRKRPGTDECRNGLHS